MLSIPHIILIYGNIMADYWLGMNILFKKDDQMTICLGIFMRNSESWQ